MTFRVNPEEHIQKEIFWYGYYEKKHVLSWELFIQPDFTVADVGANAGYYSLVASKKITKGKIYSFEPNPAAFEMLLENIHINKIKNIYPFALAISVEDEVKDLFISENDNTGMTGLSKAENFSGRVASVQTTSLDHWVASMQVKKLDLVKIDIEGAEMLALEGMKATIQSHRPGIFIEICDALLERFGSNYRDIYSFFDGYQYNAFKIVDRNIIQKIHLPIEDELVLFLPHEYVFPGVFTIIK